MRKIFLILLFLVLILQGWTQSNIPDALETLNNGSVDYVLPKNISGIKDVILLDTRELEEFETSHLKNSIWVGYEDFDLNHAMSLLPKKDAPIVLYCSIGVRSEDIGEKLQKAGYSNVKNLYGGIFQWKNEGNPVYDSSGKETQKVHAYSKFWGKLLTKGEKIYSNKTESLEPKQ